jgi:hypothetical protein
MGKDLLKEDIVVGWGILGWGRINRRGSSLHRNHGYNAPSDYPD